MKTQITAYINGSLASVPLRIGQQGDGNVTKLRCVLPSDADAGVSLSTLSISMEFKDSSGASIPTPELVYKLNGSAGYVEYVLEPAMLRLPGFGTVQVIACDSVMTKVWHSEPIATYVGASNNAIPNGDILDAIVEYRQRAASDPAGELATARGVYSTLAERLSKIGYWINVKDFGAIGDGVVDDTVAIQAAFSALPLIGGTVYFPAGTYKLNSTIYVKRTQEVYQTTIQGAGCRATEIDFYGSTACISAVGTGSNLKYLNMADIWLKKSNPDTGVQIRGLDLAYNTHFSSFDNVRITGFYDGLYTRDNWIMTLRNMHITNNTHDGVHFDNTQSGDGVYGGAINNINFIGGEVSNNGNDNFYINGLNNIIDGVDYSTGGANCIEARYAYGLNIRGYMESPGSVAGINLLGCKSVTIDDPAVSYWGINTKILYAVSTVGLVVNGFSCFHSADTVALAGSYGIYLDICSSVSIINPAINICETGIYVSNCAANIVIPVFTNCSYNIVATDNAANNLIVSMKSQFYSQCTFPASVLQRLRLSFIDKPAYGATSDRPNVNYPGQPFYDTTISKPIWWNGSAWKDANNTTV